MAERVNRFAKKQEAVSLRDLTSRETDSPNTSEIVADLSLDLLDFDENNEFLFGYHDLERIKNTIDESKLTAPPIVYKKDDGRYLIASGHTRVKALKDLGKKKVTCQIMALPDNEDQIKKNLIYLNTQRREAPLYIARNISEYESILRREGFKGSMDQELAKQFGYKKTMLYRYKKILSLPKELQELCAYDEIAWYGLIDNYVDIPEDKYNEFIASILSILDEEGHVSNKQVEDIIRGYINKESKKEEKVNNLEKGEKISKRFKKIVSMMYDGEIKVKRKDKEEIKVQAEELKEFLDKLIEACED
ncbi:ParB/RepB/Spo0J family partition protein [Pseudobutyrivibrio sp.]|uniref:ParB/RepB/Spo0J family partition protein n=1 Tax=Pseudobutyrivibrio sp. TaxID=2014367 RepID=UPI001B3F80C9|nr:ParB/RepB/Spo0J family partition protein [Pseudobutyrivibrio sp.]MBP3263347.1 ParB N-terminal domain-containing protein [Pseudobutyrivibrio sp.]